MKLYNLNVTQFSGRKKKMNVKEVIKSNVGEGKIRKQERFETGLQNREEVVCDDKKSSYYFKKKLKSYILLMRLIDFKCTLAPPFTLQRQDIIQLMAVLADGQLLRKNPQLQCLKVSVTLVHCHPWYSMRILHYLNFLYTNILHGV